MSFKSFFSDFKKILGLEALFWLIEVAIIAVFVFLIILCSDITALILLISAAFIASQFYLYYLFQKKIIIKVYNPDFKNNKNIILFIVLSTAIFLLIVGLLVGLILKLMANPFKVFTIGDEIFKYQVIGFISSFVIIYAYNYLLFDVKKPIKNVLVSTFFILIKYIVLFISRGINFLNGFLVGFGYGLGAGGMSISGYILMLIIMIILIILTISLLNAIHIQMIRYFQGENIIENKIAGLFKKIKK